MEKLQITKDFGSTMVIVPHQDDEVLMTAGVLYILAELEVPVTVVMVTNGDCDCPDHSKGYVRLLETIEGMKVLGIQKEQLRFMGYADTGMDPKDSFLTHLYEAEDGQKVFASSCSDKTYSLETMPEFHLEKYNCHAAYTRDMCKSDLRQLIEEKKPQNIFTTSEYDMHGDHSALCKFVYEIVDDIKMREIYEPSVYCGLVHSCAGDEHWPSRDSKWFDCPEGIEDQEGLDWSSRIVLELPEEMQTGRGDANIKYRALKKYVTALEPNAYEFLMSFIKDEEIFWKVR